jgi:hemolysin III
MMKKWDVYFLERNNSRMFSKFREPINGVTHLGGAVAAILGQIALLIVGWSGTEKIISLFVYGLSLIALFSASAAYHISKGKPAVLKTLRTLDHSAIFLLIAGTYTPFCLIAFTGFFRWGLLGIIWTVALTGILVKLFYINAPRWVNALVYVAMGWLCISAIGQMPAVLPTSSIVWLIIGGIIYTLGAVIYATRIFNFIPGKFGFHEIWHIFVLLGALAHFASVMTLLVQSG